MGILGWERQGDWNLENDQNWGKGVGGGKQRIWSEYFNFVNETVYYQNIHFLVTVSFLESILKRSAKNHSKIIALELCAKCILSTLYSRYENWKFKIV